MNSNTVEHKLSIFLSSKCGGKYAIMRKALKQLLLETGLTDVYCFETEPGSSESMPSAYLDNIETTQLFILIVDKQTAKIKSRIQAQSQNEHIRYGDNPFATINNIIVLNKLNLNEKEQAKIIQISCEFLKSPNQNTREKLYALELITNMFLSFSQTDLIKKEIEKLAQIQEDILKVYDDFFDRASAVCLSFAFNFMLLLTDLTTVEQAMPDILLVNAMEERDIIACLSFLSRLSEKIDYKKFPDEIVAALFQLCVSLQRQKERDIKYLSTKCLISLVNSKYQQIVLKQLSNCMDGENPEMKIAIVCQVKLLKCDSSIKNYILQKATIDNNYIVRDIARHHE